MKLVNPPPGGPDKAYVERSEEKGSDVNLAAYLLADGFEKDYEAAVVVTNDPDQKEPIRFVREKLGKKVVVLFPLRPGRYGSNVLKMTASHHRDVDDDVLASCQFPKVVTSSKGRQIRKPAGW